jgi:hypothetical protein
VKKYQREVQRGVEMRRLELPTSAVRLQRSTRLSYIPDYGVNTN